MFHNYFFIYFNSISQAKDKREDAEEYYKMIYGLLLCNKINAKHYFLLKNVYFLAKYFSNENINLNLGCIYSLYIIFLSQPEFERVQININLNVLKKINNFFKSEQLKKNIEFKMVIEKLLALNALTFGLLCYIEILCFFLNIR